MATPAPAPPAAPRLSVFVSHGSAQHALALALRARLREAGFEPYVYDPRTVRPPAQVDELERMTSVWMPAEATVELVNIAHLRRPIEDADCVLLLDDADAVHEIASRHTQGEVAYAGWLARLRARAPAVIALPPRQARALVLDGDAEELRRELPRERRRARPWVTLPRMLWPCALALAGAAAAGVPQGSAGAVCTGMFAFGVPVWLLAASLPLWMLPFVRAVFLGEVNAASPLVTLLLGHPTRQMAGGDPVEATIAEVARDLFIAQFAPLRRLLLRAVFAAASALLMLLLPLAAAGALGCLLHAVR